MKIKGLNGSDHLVVETVVQLQQNMQSDHSRGETNQFDTIPSDISVIRLHPQDQNVFAIGDNKIDAIMTALGEPYWKGHNCLVYNMDCVVAMSTLSKEGILVDLTLTSPPYNIGKEYESTMDVEKYVAWCTKWIGLVHSITSKNGAMWLNVGYLEIPGRARAIPIPYLLWDKIQFYLMQEIVWHYGAGVACKRAFSPRNEKWLWYVKNKDSYTFNLDDIRDPNVKYPNQRKNGKLRCNPAGKNPSDVWIIPKVTSGSGRACKERTPHPAQFPEAVVERALRGASSVGDLVMDPFLGSGSTAVVALKAGRMFVGFEINTDYCKFAVERIKNALNV